MKTEPVTCLIRATLSLDRKQTEEDIQLWRKLQSRVRAIVHADEFLSIHADFDWEEE